jgi:hypothetical protein
VTTTLARGLAWAVVGLLAVVLLAQPGGPLGPRQALAGAALTVTGDVRDLAVGGVGTLVLTVDNPLPHDVVVRRLTASVVADDGCLVVEPWSGELPVSAEGTARAELAVTVRPDARCGGRSWELAYSAAT